MRSIIVMAMFTASLASGAANGYEEERILNLGADGIGTLSIEAGAGELDVTGISGADEILVTATIYMPGRNDDKAREKIESDLVLTLEKQGNTAVLKSSFEHRLFQFGDSPSVELVVRMPESMNLSVDDGSGSIEIADVLGDIEIVDGSGAINLANVGGEIEIDDGSGSIVAQGVGGDVSIDDGSGSIRIEGVAGSVVIEDGSGSISVSDVEQDLIIVDDGSGGLNFSDIKGRVEKEG